MADDPKTYKDGDWIDGLTHLVRHTEHLIDTGRFLEAQKALEQLLAGHPTDVRVTSLKLKLDGALKRQGRSS